MFNNGLGNVKEQQADVNQESKTRRETCGVK